MSSQENSIVVVVVVGESWVWMRNEKMCKLECGSQTKWRGAKQDRRKENVMCVHCASLSLLLLTFFLISHLLHPPASPPLRSLSALLAIQRWFVFKLLYTAEQREIWARWKCILRVQRRDSSFPEGRKARTQNSIAVELTHDVRIWCVRRWTSSISQRSTLCCGAEWMRWFEHKQGIRLSMRRES